MIKGGDDDPAAMLAPVVFVFVTIILTLTTAKTLSLLIKGRILTAAQTPPPQP